VGSKAEFLAAIEVGMADTRGHLQFRQAKFSQSVVC
jgi:hypothetical protein